MDAVREYLVRGARLGLAALAAADVGQPYLAWMQDPEVLRYTESRHGGHSLESLRVFVDSCGPGSGSHLLGIFELDSGRHVGNLKIGPVHPLYAVASLGIIIGRKECWGRGYATEAIRLAAKFAFGRLGLFKLTAGCIDGNQASRRAFEKAGFRLEGVRRKENLCEGQRRDVIELGLLREEWEHAKD